jgi:hypothetical protein
MKSESATDGMFGKFGFDFAAYQDAAFAQYGERERQRPAADLCEHDTESLAALDAAEPIFWPVEASDVAAMKERKRAAAHCGRVTLRGTNQREQPYHRASCKCWSCSYCAPRRMEPKPCSRCEAPS